MESESQIDWAKITSTDFWKRLTESGNLTRKIWLRDWRKRRKVGNLKKRMPSKKKRKQYYKQINKNYGNHS